MNPVLFGLSIRSLKEANAMMFATRHLAGKSLQHPKCIRQKYNCMMRTYSSGRLGKVTPRLVQLRYKGSTRVALVAKDEKSLHLLKNVSRFVPSLCSSLIDAVLPSCLPD